MELYFAESKVEDIIPLRHKVLRIGRPIETCHFSGDNDQSTYHFSAKYKDEVVGCLSFMLATHSNFEEEKAYQLRGMAVSPEYRGRRIGEQLLSYAENALVKKGFRFIWCNARETAIRFYEKQAYTSYGRVYHIPKIGNHMTMYKYLKDAEKRVY